MLRLAVLLVLAVLSVQAVHAVPGEVSGVQAAGGGFGWNLEAQAIEYRVYRGRVSALGPSGRGSCYVPRLTRIDFVEPADPQPGESFYYLVAAADDTGEGPVGEGSAAQPRLIDTCSTGDPLGLSVATPTTDAYELEGTSATFRILRPSALDLPEITARFTLVGDDDPRRGAASADDYVLTDGGGAPVDYSITIPEGTTAVDIAVTPVADSLVEVPESLQLLLLGDPSYELGASVSGIARIRDAAATADNERLMLAFLSAEGSATTFASGISVLRVGGDNDSATVDLSFSGLTSPQNAVHIHVANPVDGPHVESLPLGQVSGHLWQIRAAQFLITDQQVLDALLGGMLYVNVHSTNYPAGEIRGTYGEQLGSTELQVPPDPPALPAITGTQLDRDIARFLIQSTFGATPELMDEVRQLIQDNGGDRIAGMEAWIDRQMDAQLNPGAVLLEFTRASSQLYLDNERDRRAGWWTHARYGGDQLRQRMAFALSEILVTSDANAKIDNKHLAAAEYYDILMRGAFGSYRDLLLEVSLHPIMGHYLSHLRNQKEQRDEFGQVITSPDENYAREIMQLFTFGLVQRHLDGTIALGADGRPLATYDNTTITEMAKVFTGLSFGKRDDNGVPVDNTNFNLGLGGAATQIRWLYPMAMFQAYHDEGEKTIFDGHVFAAGQAGMQDVEIAHDLLAAHPTTAPFVSRRLIQRLVTSNPSRGYVYRVAQRFQQTNGDLGQVVRAILLDYEARSLDVIEDVGFGKQKEPLLRLMALMRFLSADSLVPLSEMSAVGYPPTEFAKFPADATIFRLNLTNLGQMAQSSPTVFNFFLPDYKQPGALGNAGLVAPEFQISTESQLYHSINYRRNLLFRTTGLAGSGVPAGYADDADDIRPDLTALQAVYDAELAVGTELSASEALVDTIDLHLNAAGLAHRYKDAPEPNPRSVMVEAVVNTGDSLKVKKRALHRRRKSAAGDPAMSRS